MLILYAAAFPVTHFKKAFGRLTNKKLILKERRIVFLEEKVYFPLVKPDEEIMDLGGRILEVPDYFFPERPKKILSLTQLEKKLKIPFPKSINIIGDIALLNTIPDPKYLCKIGEAILTNYGVRAVFLKASEIEEPYRTAKWVRIAGHGDTFTVHIENKFAYALDISKVFFNPRLGGERLRVINQVQEDERIIDMFTGVGPFAIPMARKRALVHAIDINPDAIRYAKMNQEINNVPEEKLVLHNDDAKKVTMSLRQFASRIIMNYPEKSLEFLDSAIGSLKRDSGIIHLYIFWRERSRDKAIERVISELKKRVADKVTSYKVVYINASREVAPRKFMLSIDLHVKK